MIAVLGFATIIIFLYVTMTKKLSIQSALIGIPVIAAIIGGFGFDIGKMMIAGVIKVTPSAMIPIFAVIYFGIMIDAGLFDPMVNRILKLVKGDPVKITIGAAVLAMLVSLDGDGTTTFIISVSAMLPITTKLKMNPLILPFAVGMAAGVMNPLPWSGPTTRVMLFCMLILLQFLLRLYLPWLLALPGYYLPATMLARRNAKDSELCILTSILLMASAKTRVPKGRSFSGLTAF